MCKLLPTHNQGLKHIASYMSEYVNIFFLPTIFVFKPELDLW